MKIYTKHVWQWQPDGTLKSVPEECESFDYEGPLELSGSTALYATNPIAANMQQKNKTPPQPDYVGAAQAQSAGSIGTALANNIMAHPNVNTPLGSQTWNQTGSTGIDIPGLGHIDLPNYTQNVQLSPSEQKLYEQQTGLSSGLYNQAASSLSPDTSGIQGIQDKAYQAFTSRLDPQWAQNEQMQKTQLMNQGLTPGTEAYDNAMRVFNQGKNDAYQQAQLGAIQTLPLAIQARDMPLNELNALRTGSQVNMPQFQQAQFPGTAQGPNVLGATQNQAQWEQNLYNQQQANANSTTQGLVGIGTAAAMYF